jgi:hypothetical protein
MQGNKEINRLEVEIDDTCRRILALRHPAASNLHLITTALKIVTNLERMGDLAVNIDERAKDLNQAPSPKPWIGKPSLSHLSSGEACCADECPVDPGGLFPRTRRSLGSKGNGGRRTQGTGR